MLKTSTSHFYQTQTKIFTKRINASTRACSTMISVRRESLRRWRRHLPLQTAGMCALQQDSSLSGGLASASSPLYLSYDAQYRTLGCVIITAWLQLICILKKACIYPQFNYLLQPTLKHFLYHHTGLGCLYKHYLSILRDAALTSLLDSHQNEEPLNKIKLLLGFSLFLLLLLFYCSVVFLSLSGWCWVTLSPRCGLTGALMR